MPVLQYQCSACASVFEHLFLKGLSVSCLNCGAGEDSLGRLASTYFYPNKTFCPHDKILDTKQLQSELTVIMVDDSLSCAGCGTDGAAGRCQGGSCGNCSCGGGGCATKKLKKIVTAPAFDLSKINL